MTVIDVIARKRDGFELSAQEIGLFISGVASGSVPDYQCAAWLMAVYLNGMTRRETLDLTVAMRNSGEQIDLSDLPGPPAVDKHSTGGVGDKTSLVVVPILAAAGVPVLKMSGRGLGFSGGTVDKLESIAGFRTELSISEAKENVKRIGAALISQSADLAPADRILYSLRDVTATTDCIPLIASSIMSKKLAAGGRRIILDVKCGKGAFTKNPEQARRLAEVMVWIGKEAGVPTTALITRMDEPLGAMVGNALEVREALQVITQGCDTGSRSQSRFTGLCLELAAHGFWAAGVVDSINDGLAESSRLLRSGEAHRKFVEIVAAQGGPKSPAEIADSLRESEVTHEVTCEYSGTVVTVDAEMVGRLATDMGAGRSKKGESIDHSVGIRLICEPGDSVQRGQVIAILYLKPEDFERRKEYADRLRSAYILGMAADIPDSGSLVIEVID